MNVVSFKHRSRSMFHSVPLLYVLFAVSRIRMRRYMLLAERLRSNEEKVAMKLVLEEQVRASCWDSCSSIFFKDCRFSGLMGTWYWCLVRTVCIRRNMLIFPFLYIVPFKLFLARWMIWIGYWIIDVVVGGRLMNKIGHVKTFRRGWYISHEKIII